MSEDSAKNSEQAPPADPRKREALKKLGRYAAYTAPATLVALGYTAAQGAGGSGVSPPPPPLLPPPPPT